MVFLGCVQDKTLSGHVIKTIQLSTSGTNTCQQMCFIEANCMSYNIGPIEGDQRSCELNDADNVLDHGDVVAKDGFEFCTFKVGFIQSAYKSLVTFFIMGLTPKRIQLFTGKVASRYFQCFRSTSSQNQSISVNFNSPHYTRQGISHNFKQMLPSLYFQCIRAPLVSQPKA